MKKISLLSLSLIMIISNGAYAANILHSKQEAEVSLNNLSSTLHLSKDYQFVAGQAFKLPNGKVKQRLTQYYQNIPVWGFSLAATQASSGKLKDVFGNYLSNIEADINHIVPAYDKNQIVQLAMKNIALSKNAVVKNTHADLYILQDKRNKARLIYLVSTLIENRSGFPSRPYFMMDANTGEIINQWEGLTTRNATGPGGNSSKGKYVFGVDYGYLDVDDACQMDNANVSTFDMNNTTDKEKLFKFATCPSDGTPENTYKEINGAYSPLNDGHFFANAVYNMYQSWFNVGPLNSKIKIRVHYDKRFEGSFWDGTTATFGDGFNTYFPLASLDFVAHELSHGYTEQHSGLINQNQSGGVGESFSDISAQATQYFLTKTNDWQIGTNIYKMQTALRYFFFPSWDGHSIENAKDYTDGMDVHYSSGVFNKAFYTLATMPNWDTEKGFRAFFLANAAYWNANSSFNDAACGVLKAAEDIGYSTYDVYNAFQAVGVDASCGLPPPPPPCIRKTTFLVSPSNKDLHPGEGTVFLLWIFNSDSAICGSSNYTLGTTIPAPLTGQLSQKSITVAPGKNKFVSVTVWTQTNIGEGVYPLQGTAKNDTTGEDYGVRQATVTVTKA